MAAMNKIYETILELMKLNKKQSIALESNTI